MSMVPYVGRLALPAARYAASYPRWSPLAKYAAGQTAKFFGRAARRGATTMYRRGRKRVKKLARKYTHKRRVRQRIGERVGTGSSKQALSSDSDTTVLLTRTLHVDPLTDISKNITADENIHERARDIVNFRGAKLCYNFRNQQNNTMLCNFAVLRVKKAGGITPETTDFFRSQGAATGRARNFASNLTAMEFHCLPINTDEYDVLMHKRFRIQGLSDASDKEAQGTNFFKIEKYIKVGRQLRYDSTGGTPTGNSALYAVYWFDFQMAGSGTGASFGPQIQHRVVAYFKEPKN